MKTQKEFAGFLVLLLISTLPVAAAAPSALPFTNMYSMTATSVWQFAATNQLAAYNSGTSNDYKVFRGVFTPSSSDSKLAVHSDDGSKVLIDGTVAVDNYGTDTHFNDLSTSFTYLNQSFTAGVEYCVEIQYTNHLHTTNDKDGVTLYAYAGGGSVRDGIIVRGEDAVCLGGTTTLTADCCATPVSWSSGNTYVATVANGVVTGVHVGGAVITATDDNGKTGTKTVTVIDPKVSPNTFTLRIGETNTFCVTNDSAGGVVTWNPSGTLSGDTKTNTVVFSTAGSNILVTATHYGCVGRATGVVVAVTSLTADVTNLCNSGQIIYTAQTTPPGYESWITWSGEGLSGSGAKRTNTYSTVGVKVVTVTCGTSMKQMSNTVNHIEVTPKSVTVLAEATSPVSFYLTNSFGGANWQITPSGGAWFAGGSSGDTVTVNPGTVGTNYTITASAYNLSSCQDTAAFQVVKVSFSQSPVSLCEYGSVQITATVTPASALGSLTFDTVTNVSSGQPNTLATITPASGSADLTINALAVGTATLRVRLGDSTYYGPAINVFRITFPTNAVYVPEQGPKLLSVSVTPASAAGQVTYASANTNIATVSGTGTNATIFGVSYGTTQIYAKAGTNSTCASKDVTVVRTSFSPDELNLCVGSSGVVTANILPANAPVSFSLSKSNYNTLWCNGTSLTITSQAPASTMLRAMVGEDVFDYMRINGIQVQFPTNDFYVAKGSTNGISPTIKTPVFSPSVSFSVADTNIAALTPASNSRFVVLKGNNIGSTQINSLIGTNISCTSKNVSVVDFQYVRFNKSTMGTSWRDVDKDYKFLGIYTHQTVNFGVTIAPTNQSISPNLIKWSNYASGTGPTNTVTFNNAGNWVVTASFGGARRSAQIEVIDPPTGIGQYPYATLSLVYSGTAMLRNLIGRNLFTLEPYIWATNAIPGTQHNTVADAARHAYWNCLLSRYTCPGYAEAVTRNHEVSQPGPCTETIMDLHNNLMGISIANHVHGTNNLCCQTNVLNAVTNGLLWYLDSSYGVWNTSEDALLQPSNK